MPEMRLVFMGTPDFAVATLDAIVGAGHEVVCVYTQPPKPAGRGKKLARTPVHRRAEEIGIEVRCPRSLKGADEQAAFTALAADAAVVAAYGLILPVRILDAPRLGCLNVHASLLPRWRGAAPIQRAIMAGDGKTGVCIMQMDEGLDTGSVLLREEIAIGSDETAASLHDKLAVLGAKLIVKVLDDPAAFPAVPQDESGVTYAAKIEKSEARVQWDQPARDVDRHIRGLSPFPGAWCELEGERIKLLLSRISDGAGAPGEMLGEGLRIACGDGAVEILRLQRAGRGAVSGDEFLRGFAISRGTLLE